MVESNDLVIISSVDQSLCKFYPFAIVEESDRYLIYFLWFANPIIVKKS